MRVGVDSYCFHRYFGEAYEGLEREAAVTWDVYDFLDYVHSIGVRSVSLETCFMPALDEAFLDALRERLDDGGFERVLAWGHPVGLEGGTNRGALEDLRGYIPRARRLGADIMRIVCGSRRTRDAPREPQIRMLTDWLRDVCGTAEDYGVTLAVENHIDFTSGELLRIIDGVNSAYLKVNLDTGNMLRVFEDPVEGARRLAPYAVATHVKDIAVDRGSPQAFSFWPACPLGQGIVDIPAVVKELDRAGYQGALTVEIDLVHPKWANLPEETLVRESVAYLRQVLADSADG